MADSLSERTKVLVVEDNPADARRIEQEINGSGTFACIGHTGEVGQACDLAREHRPSLILYDLHLLGQFRPEGIAALKDIVPAARVLVLSNYEDTELIFQSLRHGAEGYVLKSDDRLAILQALRDALEGDPPLTRSVARRILKHFQEPVAGGGEAGPELTARQREVVHFICQGWTNKEIAARLDISTDAVKQHVAAVKRKLDVRSRTQISGRFGRMTSG